uniref:Saposin B-type domain-containing protein n=1 Tax=Haemonchus contortus TaxID=6289 RepID=A0A7I4XSK5_HAECO
RYSFPRVFQKLPIGSAMTMFSMLRLTTLLVLIAVAMSVAEDSAAARCRKCETVSNVVKDHFVKNGLKDVTPAHVADKIISVCKQKLAAPDHKKCEKIATENAELIHTHLRTGQTVRGSCQELKLC